MSTVHPLTNSDYARLLVVRTRLRAFEQWSARQAHDHGLTTAQHQLMLVIGGYPDRRGPTINQAANYLMTSHTTAIGLIDRAQLHGLIKRTGDTAVHDALRLALTNEGHTRLRELSAVHISELARLHPMIDALINDLDGN
jgi:DNA-binding MarR family transcriptional regulator